MPKRDYVQLLAVDGDARKFFKNAAGGAGWVDQVCDEIRMQLLDTQLYTCLDDDVTKMINDLVTHPLTRRVHFGKDCDQRWQVSVDFEDCGAWTCATADTIPDAISKLYAQEVLIRKKYGMKEL
jgi:hypothetical protein